VKPIGFLKPFEKLTLNIVGANVIKNLSLDNLNLFEIR
jgi:hypothetical protein